MKIIATFSIILFSAISTFAQNEIPEEIQVLLDKNICTACHKLNEKLIGPSFIELAKKGNSEKEIMALIFEPNVENWPGYPPMSPMPHIDKAEVKKIAKWIKTLE